MDLWFCRNCENYYESPAEVIFFDGKPEYFCTCGSGKIHKTRKRVVHSETKQKRKWIDIQDVFLKEYRIKTSDTCIFGCRMRTHVHLKERTVCKWKQANSFASTFTLLHEIGHVENNNSKMRRAEQEYYATVWAIERCKELGIEVPDSTYRDYQAYIDRELARGIRRGGTHYEELKLRENM